jgi:hypothetical protein
MEVDPEWQILPVYQGYGAPDASHPWLVAPSTVAATVPRPVPLSLPMPTVSLLSPPYMSITPLPAGDANINPASTQPQLSTPVNAFGLSWCYYSTAFPQHDPEAEVTPADWIDKPSDVTPSAASFGPYPNLNSLLLGDWYWTHGQKSVQDFKTLIGIVGSEAFQPVDVRATPWDRINKALASDDYVSQEWMADAAGWIASPVTISVPFHERRVPTRDSHQTPAPRPYVVPGFRYRRLLSVIEEKLTNKKHHHHFHYEPYKLQWQPPGSNLTPMRVYSEAYTSDAFLEAHLAVQASPPVPGCTLLRVIVGLMLWSDATHLTSFSEAKLHPLYMSFANESKYRRSKSSERLMSHIAYFRTVSFLSFPYLLVVKLIMSSSRMTLKSLLTLRLPMGLHRAKHS